MASRFKGALQIKAPAALAYLAAIVLNPGAARGVPARRPTRRDLDGDFHMHGTDNAQNRATQVAEGAA